MLTVSTAGAAPTTSGLFSGANGNVCGTPSLILPTGLTDDDLPTALQLDGRACSENRLITLAVAFQTATAWHAKHLDLNRYK